MTVAEPKKEIQIQPTINDIIMFISAQSGQTFYTTRTQSPFTVAVVNGTFVYSIASGEHYTQTQSNMEQLLQRYAALGHSLKPSDYHYPQPDGSYFSSYFAGLMTAFQNSQQPSSQQAGVNS